MMALLRTVRGGGGEGRNSRTPTWSPFSSSWVQCHHDALHRAFSKVSTQKSRPVCRYGNIDMRGGGFMGWRIMMWKTNSLYCKASRPHNYNLMTFLFQLEWWQIFPPWQLCRRFVSITLLHRSQTWNLRFATVSVNIRTANGTSTTWRQNLHKLEVLQASMKSQVQS